MLVALSVQLDNSFKTRYIRRRAFSFEEVANCIRLAHKYGFQEILEDSMGELTDWFPADFDSWDSAPGCDSTLDPIVAVNLARLTNNMSVLAIALYLCCQIDVKDLVRGRVRSGNVVDTLSDDDFVRCMHGKALLCTRKVQMVQDVFAHVENPACTRGPRWCNASLDNIMAEQTRCVEEGDADVLAPWNDIIRSHRRRCKPMPKSPLCSPCVAFVIDRETKIRAELWSDLPYLFGLQ